MRKLCIAVILLSFFGFGPLKSFFHSVISTDGKNTAGETIIQKMKDTTNLFPQRDNKQVKNYLITEKSADKKSSLNGTALVLRYDTKNNKLMVGSILLPENTMIENKEQFDTVKKTVEKDYQVSIDHYFNLDTAGLARIIDLLAPKGLTLTQNTSKNGSGNASGKIHGNELVSIINSGKPEEINNVITALKNEIKTNQSAEKLVTLAPSIINEAMKSIKTDLGKGELLAMGFSAMMNPVTTIESYQIAEESQKEKAHTVNSMTTEKKQTPVFN
ncbi:LCP family protein [Neobacillus ginsengisoli]|uniref:Anionic cell wall polymer biosynthesis LytR-Cps2A-Psr (LCP) family protein n=1 Tax=Neobacillus ginsengisoli TaxID=904295 RepID=A0ABT9XRX0_9BACI|nr:hypothetical protein [Neobacillus ginsengisoli]MDQ0197684.1 anionic cell wall polymer biosynthesis LytR-Cps2A-Psr (LCP) family protein [Neobacillus ginsengisoli]